MRVSDGVDSLELERTSDVLKVSIESAQLDVSAREVIKNYVTFADDVAEGYEAELVYTVPSSALSLEESLGNAKTELQRLELAQKLSSLNELSTGTRIPFVHPENIFLMGTKMRVVHFGLRNLLTPRSFNPDAFLKQYKALVLHILNPQMAYETLINGQRSLRDEMSRSIIEKESVGEIIQIIDDTASRKLAENAARSVNVPKGRYRFFECAAAVVTVVALGLGWFTYSAYASQLPQQKAVITAQSDFLTNDYAQTLADLKNYDPANLPKSARYVLAVSAVNLADLTLAQKKAVLNTISTKTDDNTLNYWAYLGRGDFDQALNLAENLGDNQLILQAYLDLYQVTKLNTEMDGSKKQQLLDGYKQKINELTKKIQSK